MTSFIRRSRGLKTLEGRNIFEKILLRNFGDIDIDLTHEQYV